MPTPPAPYDVFVSYAHIDNAKVLGEPGWITRFHTSLSALLGMKLGREARIWRDDKLQGNDVFADEITDRFDAARLLISILSPRYLDSDWCKREIREFCERKAQNGGVVVENKSRVFKVQVGPVESLEPLPEVVRECLGYEFFRMQGDADIPLDPVYGKEFEQQYLLKVQTLAHDLRVLIKKLEGNAATGSKAGDAAEAATGGAQAGPVRTVYLAQCSHDMRACRDKVEAELKGAGYTVLPDQQLPLEDEVRYREQVGLALERAGLSVHLVGASYGAVPDGPSLKSVVELQNELAVQRCRVGSLRRLIWLPKGTDGQQEEQKAFIRLLHGDATAQFGADLITGGLEELKTAIHTNLAALANAARTPAATDAPAADATRMVYVVLVEADRKASVPLRKHLKDECGFVVETPAFDGSAAQVREVHQRLLESCDALIVFYGAGDEAWKRTVDNDLLKIAGSRNGRPLLARCTYLAGPKTGDKQDLVDMEEPGLVVGFDAFQPAAMAGFVEALQRRGEAR